MFNQIATERNLPDCTVVADVGGVFACDVTKAKDLIENVKYLKLSKLIIANKCKS